MFFLFHTKYSLLLNNKCLLFKIRKNTFFVGNTHEQHDWRSFTLLPYLKNTSNYEMICEKNIYSTICNLWKNSEREFLLIFILELFSLLCWNIIVDVATPLYSLTTLYVVVLSHSGGYFSCFSCKSYIICYVVGFYGILKLRSRQIITNYIHNVYNCYQSCNKGGLNVCKLVNNLNHL